MLQLNKKHKKGSSLIEVIIVLAIVSFTIIASMALVARTRLEIKNNEIQDNANEILLKALEALKSPSKVVLTQDPSLTGVGPYYFSLKVEQDGTYVLEYKRAGSFTALPKTDGSFDFSKICTDQNPFHVTDGRSFNYCQMVEISPILKAGISRELYKVSTTIIYQTSNEAKSETLISYRYGSFTKK